MTWPATRQNEALDALRRAAGLAGEPVEHVRMVLPAAAPAELRAAAPLLVPTVSGEWLAVVGASRRSARLVGPDGSTCRLGHHELAGQLTAAGHDDVEALLTAAGLRGAARRRAASTLAVSHRTAPLTGAIAVHQSPAAPIARQCRRAGVLAQLVGFVAAHAAGYVLLVLSWVLLGRAALTGQVGPTQLAAWAGLLVAAVPCTLVATRLRSAVAVGAGRLLRRRLLHGALRLDPEESRGEGVGRLLGRALEAEAVEDLAVGGGLLGLVAVVELALAAFALGAGLGLPAAALLGVWVMLALALAFGYLRRRRRWAAARLACTNDVVEKLIGHRTRLAQQPPEHWHRGETETLAGYHRLGAVMDRRLTVLTAAARGWVLVGVLALCIAADTGATAAQLAAGAGGVLLAAGGLRVLVTGLAQLADAATAWDSIRPLIDAATRGQATTQQPAMPKQALDNRLLVADNLSYRYPGRTEPAVHGASLEVTEGERVLVEGTSGSGKSTLVAMLAGLRTPTAGRLTLHGRERAEVSTEAWRTKIVIAPQFHDNHLVLGPLVYNLLLGRGWPPAPADIEAAETMCEALGLGPLLQRMPAGIGQIVGETGWQLSHGERSLVYLARALLQHPDLLILDETFGALDPATKHQAVTVTVEGAATLLVVHQ